MAPLKIARPLPLRVSHDAPEIDSRSAPGEEPQTLADWEMVLVGGGEDHASWP